MTKLASTNPSRNYEVIGEVEISTPEAIKSAVSAARNTQKMWRDLGVKERAALLRKVSKKFEENAERIYKRSV